MALFQLSCVQHVFLSNFVNVILFTTFPHHTTLHVSTNMVFSKCLKLCWSSFCASVFVVPVFLVCCPSMGYCIDSLCALVVRVPVYQRSGFDSWSCRVFWEVVGLERGLLSLVSTIQELLGRNSSGSRLENREYGRRDPSRWPRGALYPQKLALTSTTWRSLGRYSSLSDSDQGV
jgi:hypothetical protein